MKRSWTQDAPKRIHKQRFLLLTFTVLFSALVILGCTFAWFTSADTRKNEMKTDDLKFGFTTVDIFETPDEVDPGDTVPKEVRVKNTKDLDGFTRVMILPEVYSPEGELLPANGPNETGILSYNGGSSDWLYGGDGYWYYLKKLAPGQETANLFTEVKITAALAEEYADATLRIKVQMEAVEVAKWKYREAWWNGLAQASLPLSTIDTALSALAQ